MPATITLKRLSDLVSVELDKAPDQATLTTSAALVAKFSYYRDTFYRVLSGSHREIANRYEALGGTAANQATLLAYFDSIAEKIFEHVVSDPQPAQAASRWALIAADLAGINTLSASVLASYPDSIEQMHGVISDPRGLYFITKDFFDGTTP